VYETASSVTSKQLVVHHDALPADAPAPACQGGNLSNRFTQFPLVTVIQLLKEEEVDLPTDASFVPSGKPSEVAPDTDNLDLVNMPAAFDYEEDETSWRKGLPPGEVGLQLSELGCLKVTATVVLPLSSACVWMDSMETLGCQMQKERKMTYR